MDKRFLTRGTAYISLFRVTLRSEIWDYVPFWWVFSALNSVKANYSFKQKKENAADPPYTISFIKGEAGVKQDYTFTGFARTWRWLPVCLISAYLPNDAIIHPIAGQYNINK